MIRLLQISIFAIASVVVYASVYGLATLFAAVAVPVIVAGTALELGKYVSMSYAYQHWGVMRVAERALMLLFLSVTMIFTSVGVFSYLGQGYQTSYLTLDTNRAKAAELQTQETELTARIATINKQIENLPPAVVRGRIALMREYEKERAPLMLQRETVLLQARMLRTANAESEVHAGPISFIARVTNVTIERAATWSIMAFTLCLDPFALYLTALLNKLLLLRRRASDVPTDDNTPPESRAAVPSPEVVETPEPTTSVPLPIEPLPTLNAHFDAPTPEPLPVPVLPELLGALEVNSEGNTDFPVILFVPLPNQELTYPTIPKIELIERVTTPEIILLPYSYPMAKAVTKHENVIMKTDINAQAAALAAKRKQAVAAKTAKPATKTKAVVKPATKTKAVVKPAAKAKVVAKPAAKAKAVAKPKAKAPAAKAKPAAKPKAVAAAKAKPVVKAKPKAVAAAKAKPVVKAVAKPQAKAVAAVKHVNKKTATKAVVSKTTPAKKRK